MKLTIFYIILIYHANMGAQVSISNANNQIINTFTGRINTSVGYNFINVSNYLLNTSTLLPYNITQIELVYPGAKNPNLQKVISFRSTGNPDSLLVLLNLSGRFTNITKDAKLYPFSCNFSVSSKVNDPLSTNGTYNNYHLNMIEAPCAWNNSIGDHRIKIGVADVKYNFHEDLDNAPILAGIGNWTNGHMNRVAGVAAGTTNNNKGLAAIGYNSKLVMYQLKFDGAIYAPDMRKAIWDMYIDNYSVPKAGQVKIICVSWGGTGLEPLAAQEITEGGTTLVLAAGNDNDDPTVIPHQDIANIPGVILVSGVNENNLHGPTNRKRSIYNDICAPSENIPVVGFNSSNEYFTGNGTSLAAPMVAGTIGLMMALNPCLTPAEIEAILKTTTDPISDASLYPGLLGAGRLNSNKAVQAAKNTLIRYEQNKPISGVRKYPTGNYTQFGKTKVLVGRNVTNTETIGNVIIPNGSNVKYMSEKEVEIFDGFEVISGGTLEIDIKNPNCY